MVADTMAGWWCLLVIDKGNSLLNKFRDSESPQTAISFWKAVIPVLVLATLIVYGLIIRRHWNKQPEIPLEIIFLLAAAATVVQLLLMGHRWTDIQNSIVNRFRKAIPAFLILFCVGMVISSWIVAGTIPMLVYYGLKLVSPQFLYVLSFLAAVVFSSLTGTSWGSVGTIGVVLIGIATALDANLGIVSGAVISGAVFGDKLSPLSDTTNMAVLGADVDLYDHIRAMFWTTLPSAIIAAAIFLVMGFVDPPTVGNQLADKTNATSQLDSAATFVRESNGESSAVTSEQLAEPELQSLLAGLQKMFRFSWWLLVPPMIVLIGSLLKVPTVPALMLSILVATTLAFTCQQFSFADVIAAVHKGFDSEMATWVKHVPAGIPELLNRGGLYGLSEAIVIAFMVFIFIGAMDHMDAMPTVIATMLSPIKSPRLTVLGTLFAAGLTNALASSQYAACFIVGDALKSRYDRLGLNRTVLSRSLEDTATMIESIIPWHPTAVYMGATLGVACADYWYWQLLSLTNIIIAVVLASAGVGLTLAKQQPRPDSAQKIPVE